VGKHDGSAEEQVASHLIDSFVDEEQLRAICPTTTALIGYPCSTTNTDRSNELIGRIGTIGSGD
jgi:hypothetical protein